MKIFSHFFWKILIAWIKNLGKPAEEMNLKSAADLQLTRSKETSKKGWVLLTSTWKKRILMENSLMNEIETSFIVSQNSFFCFWFISPPKFLFFERQFFARLTFRSVRNRKIRTRITEPWHSTATKTIISKNYDCLWSKTAFKIFRAQKLCFHIKQTLIRFRSK